jgi:hypothetical protein
MSDIEQSNGQSEEHVNGVPYRLLDGYDGGCKPSPEYIAELLKGAPPEILARIKQVADERAEHAKAADALRVEQPADCQDPTQPAD